ncbi:MAG: RHS repeat protein, partial [bacterium]|nr:RHS repeat protein [bacterium]
YTDPKEDSNPFPGWSYSLPFSWEEPQSDGHYLSTEVYDGTDAFSHCDGDLKRSSYVLYEHDELPPLSTAPFLGPIFEPWHETSRRVRARRTLYHDDGTTFAETTSQDFDGVGHYRMTATDGNFDAGNVRQATTDFNSGLGTYAVDQDTNTSTGNFSPPPVTAPWILGTFERQTVTEGAESATATSCFDADGFLTRRRTLASAGKGSHDLIAAFTPDADGNVASERYYGGDLQSVGIGADLCALGLPASPAYEIEHQYAFGTRKLSRYLNGGAPVPFNSLDLDVDQSTGMVAASRDTAGIEATFVYDALGRLTDERPEAGHGAWVKTTYIDATPTNNARVEVERQPNGGGASLAEAQVIYDSLGRVFQEKSELPSGAFGVRETRYNARGDRASVSEIELGNPANKTEFLEYDPFGRPGRIRPADGPAHDVTIAYAGVRQVARTSRVSTGAGGAETPSTFTEIYDRQGRLHRVIEPGTGTQTTYGYDEGGRMASLSMAGPVTQARLFDYDPLGFLRSETHPEIGATGNGATTYSNYDSRGNAGRMADDRRTLDYAYDAAERLLTLTSTAEGLVKQLVYDTAPTHGAGKVHRAIRHNRLGASDFVVTETFDYAGRGGRVSSVLTTSNVNDLEFLVSQTYDPLGRVEDLTYPACQGSPDCPNDPFTLRHTYQAHDLVAVGIPTDLDAGVAITYHPNRMWSTLTHGNGVVATQQNDPDGMRRPRRISVSGVVEGTPFDTGFYGYDGAGNVKAMGSDAFTYDPLSRLTGADVHGWAQDFVYDAFGNLTRVETTPPGGPLEILDLPVNGATNRLTAHGYDGSGNLTSFTGVWTHVVDPLNMPILRDHPGTDQWAAIYTASDERLATSDPASGD